MDMMKLSKAYIVFGVAVAALWPVMLAMAQNVNVSEFLFIENFVAVLASAILLLALRKTGMLVELLKSRRGLVPIFAVAMLNYVVPDFGLLYGEHFISASLASIIFRTYPILILAFIPFVLREKVTKYQLAALILGFVGIFMVVNPVLTQTSAGWLLGVGLVFGVALATAASLTIVKRYVNETESALFLYNLVSFAVYAILFVASGMPMQAIDPPGWSAILYTGIVYSVISAWGFYYVLKRLKATVITNLWYFAPFLTFVFADLLLGTPISLLYVASAGLIAAGVLIQKFDRKGGAYAPRRTGLKTAQIFDMSGAFSSSIEDDIAGVIKSGGRILAIKAKDMHRGLAHEMSKGAGLPLLITDMENRFAREIAFSAEVLGKKEDEMILFVAGKEEECEKLLDVFFAKVDAVENSQDTE